MRHPSFRIAIALVAVSVSATAAPPLHAADSTPVTYQLTEESLYEAGCLPPCLCPVLERKPFHGTFTLAPIGSNNLLQAFAVTEVNWMMPGNGAKVQITGRGTYAICGEAEPQHQLVLDLVVDGGPVQRFDSGLVAGGQIFPAIEIPVALNGFYCHDTVFGVQAQPGVAGAEDPQVFIAGLRVGPNPFQGRTEIGFSLRGPGPVDLRIHDVTGRVVRHLARAQWFEAGTHRLFWDGRRSDGSRAPAGMYFVRLKATDRDERGTVVTF